MRYIVVLSAIVIVFLTAWQGTIPNRKTAQFQKLVTPEERRYTITNFDKIDLGVPVDVILRQAENFSVRAISKYQGALDLVELEVKNGTLVFSVPRTEGIKGFPEITYYITLPRLEEVRLHGSGDIYMRDLFVADNFRLALTGSGDIKMDKLSVREYFSLTLSGSGDVEFKDLNAQSAVFSLVGSGDIKGKNVVLTGDIENTLRGSGCMKFGFLGCRNAEMSLVGSGDYIFADCVFSGSADIKITGSGAFRSKHVRGENKFLTKLRGSGDIVIGELEAKEYNAELSLSGTIQVLRGNVRLLKASLFGSGDIVLRGLLCRVASAWLNGSGDIHINVLDELYMERVKGSGEIYYSGSPQLRVKKGA